VGRNSQVICPGYDWPAAVAAVRSLGAQVIFADIEPGSLTIDPDRILPCLTPSTRAVIATHLFGIPADVVGLRAVLDPLDVPVIEDCAQGLGATIRGKAVGALGTAAAFSFGPGKIVDAGEGGLVAFENPDLHRRAVMLSQHPLRQLLSGIEPVVLDGCNARIHPVAAILAVSELRFLDERIAKARRQAKAIDRFISERDGIEAIGIDPYRRPSWWRVPVRSSLADPTSLGLTLEQPGARVLGASTPGHRTSRASAGVMVASAPLEVVS
jgi:dTDP-4-amino-4,6-dideoxygalactose transaminase